MFWLRASHEGVVQLLAGLQSSEGLVGWKVLSPSSLMRVAQEAPIPHHVGLSKGCSDMKVANPTAGEPGEKVSADETGSTVPF